MVEEEARSQRGFRLDPGHVLHLMVRTATKSETEALVAHLKQLSFSRFSHFFSLKKQVKKQHFLASFKIFTLKMKKW
jgi:hypothetical protein